MAKVQVDSNGKVYISNGKALKASEGGITPTGTIDITENGTVDVTNYASANVNVSGSNYSGVLLEGDGSSDFNVLKTIGISDITVTSSLYQKFYNWSSLTEVNFDSLVSLTGANAMQYTFYYCPNITKVSMKNLKEISGSSALAGAFQQCTSLVSVDLSSLEEVNITQGMGSTFYGCASLVSIDFPLLNKAGSVAFYNLFGGCTSLTDVYFRNVNTSTFSSTDSFYYMLSNTGTTVTHTLHFPSNMESTISTLTSYPTFGGDSSAVQLLYDLPATS